jgi:hypothetical protein
LTWVVLLVFGRPSGFNYPLIRVRRSKTLMPSPVLVAKALKALPLMMRLMASLAVAATSPRESTEAMIYTAESQTPNSNRNVPPLIAVGVFLLGFQFGAQ